MNSRQTFARRAAATLSSHSAGALLQTPGNLSSAVQRSDYLLERSSSGKCAGSVLVWPVVPAGMPQEVAAADRVHVRLGAAEALEAQQRAAGVHRKHLGANARVAGVAGSLLSDHHPPRQHLEQKRMSPEDLYQRLISLVHDRA